jgi:hypothetical protein
MRVFTAEFFLLGFPYGRGCRGEGIPCTLLIYRGCGTFIRFPGEVDANSSRIIDPCFSGLENTRLPLSPPVN